MNLLQKIKLFFGYCPCGGRLYAWDDKKDVCNKCGEVYK